MADGATVKDAFGNAVNLSAALTTFSGLQVDPSSQPAPSPGQAVTIKSILDTPASGDLTGGKTVKLTVNMSQAVTVTGGVPTLSLNDSGTAVYVAGSGTSALTFNYTVASGQNTAALAVSGVSLNGATIKDSSGNAASFSLAGLTQTGPQIDTTAPVISLTAPSQQGSEAKPVSLRLAASVADNFPGATLTALSIGSIPTGAILSDGTHTFTSSSAGKVVNVAGWNIANLSITPASDANLALAVSATAQDRAGNTSTRTATQTITVSPLAPTASVTGTAAEGQTLTAVGAAKDGNVKLGYQWQRLIGSAWIDLPGAMSSTYLVAAADDGHQLRAVVTATDPEGNSSSAASSATATVVQALPALSIADTSLDVTAGGDVGLGIKVGAETVSVTIKGLPRYETITDNFDHRTFSGSAITLTAAEVNSGLILHSNYRGHKHPVATLTVTASNGAAGGSTTQTMTITDPPSTSTGSSGHPSTSPGTAPHLSFRQNSLMALLNQYAAADMGGQLGGGMSNGVAASHLERTSFSLALAARH